MISCAATHWSRFPNDLAPNQGELPDYMPGELVQLMLELLVFHVVNLTSGNLVEYGIEGSIEIGRGIRDNLLDLRMRCLNPT